MSKAARHASIESSISRTQEFLATPEARAALGERALALGAQLDEAFVPNEHFGVLSVPKAHRDTDRTALHMIDRRAAVRLGPGFARFAPRQREMATATLSQCQQTIGDNGLVRQMTRLERAFTKDFLQPRQPFSRPKEKVDFAVLKLDDPEQRMHAFTTTVMARAEITPAPIRPDRPLAAHAFGRPVVLFPDDGQPTNLSLACHELTHVQQFLDRPIFVPGQKQGEDAFVGGFKLRMEVEAWSVEAAADAAVEALGGNMSSHAAETRQIETLRQQLASADDPYYPHPELGKALGYYI